MSFREVRHILNTAQIHAISKNIKLITLDADGKIFIFLFSQEHSTMMVQILMKKIQLKKSL
jgi:IMP and pyridine-specific 5'-nucleotidase